MSINSKIKTQIEDYLSEKIISTRSVGGGCIADSKLIKTEKGHKYFIKTFAGSPGMFINEANGLKELKKARSIQIPEVILSSNDFLLLDYIETGAKSENFFSNFGKCFAQMHRYTAKSFGFYENNYIGATPQINLPSDLEKTDWAKFYFNKRILVQLKFAEQNGYATTELSKAVEKLGNTIVEILSASIEPPTLLHGDLWGGNYMCNSYGQAVLIDPAVYYGHREADLAMTKMFGGFTHEFYQAYQIEFPLAKGWEHREGLYLLYHNLNHLNLFGSGYYGECMRLLKQYV